MSQEFTDAELDAFEVEMGSEDPHLAENVEDDAVTGDDNVESEETVTAEAEGEGSLDNEQQGDEAGQAPDDSTQETNPEGEVTANVLADYLKNTPMEAKSKSARFLIDTPEKLQESINKSLDYHKKTAELSQ